MHAADGSGEDRGDRNAPGPGVDPLLLLMEEQGDGNIAGECCNERSTDDVPIIVLQAVGGGSEVSDVVHAHNGQTGEYASYAKREVQTTRGAIEALGNSETKEKEDDGKEDRERSEARAVVQLNLLGAVT